MNYTDFVKNINFLILIYFQFYELISILKSQVLIFYCMLFSVDE